MNKKLSIPFIVLTILILTACSAKAASITADMQTVTNVNSPGGELSDEELLILGILKLKETDQEVDAAQATELLAYWQLYNSMVNSDTAAQEEMDAIINTIKNTLTDEQMQAIDAMDLSQQDVMRVMQELGLGFTIQNGQSGDGTPENLGALEGGIVIGGSGQGGNLPSGSPPSGGVQGRGPSLSGPMSGGGGDGQGFSISIQGGDLGQEMDPEMLATLQASGGQRVGSGNMLLPSLLDAIIQYLTEISGK